MGPDGRADADKTNCRSSDIFHWPVRYGLTIGSSPSFSRRNHIGGRSFHVPVAMKLKLASHYFLESKTGI